MTHEKENLWISVDIYLTTLISSIYFSAWNTSSVQAHIQSSEQHVIRWSHWSRWLHILWQMLVGDGKDHTVKVCLILAVERQKHFKARLSLLGGFVHLFSLGFVGGVLVVFWGLGFFFVFGVGCGFFGCPILFLLHNWIKIPLYLVWYQIIIMCTSVNSSSSCPRAIDLCLVHWNLSYTRKLLSHPASSFLLLSLILQDLQSFLIACIF